MTPETRKITAHLNVEFLDEALAESGKGITETLNAALDEYRRKRIYRDIISMHGAHTFSLDLNELREDRAQEAL